MELSHSLGGDAEVRVGPQFNLERTDPAESDPRLFVENAWYDEQRDF